MPLKTATIGYGLSAKIFHIPFIHALPNKFTLYGILQRTPTAANNAAQDHPGVRTWTDVTSMLADPEIDLVVITSIPSSHYELVKASLDAGKHVICEKPFVETAKEAMQLAEKAEAKGKLLSVYQNRRWDADFITLKSLLVDGSLGRFAELESHFDRHRPEAPQSASSVGWKAKDAYASGAIYDLGTHLLDQFIALFGLPDRVTAFIGDQRVYEVEGTGASGGDSFTVLLHYDQLGMLGTAKAGVVSPEVEQLRYWARGTKGSWRKLNLDVQEDQLKEGRRPGDEGYGIEKQEANGTLTVIDSNTSSPYVSKVGPKSPPETYVGFYEEVATAIAGGHNPISATENAKLLRLIEAAKLSSTEQKTISLA